MASFTTSFVRMAAPPAFEVSGKVLVAARPDLVLKGVSVLLRASDGSVAAAPATCPAMARASAPGAALVCTFAVKAAAPGLGQVTARASFSSAADLTSRPAAFEAPRAVGACAQVTDVLLLGSSSGSGSGQWSAAVVRGVAPAQRGATICASTTYTYTMELRPRQQGCNKVVATSQARALPVGSTTAVSASAPWDVATLPNCSSAPPGQRAGVAAPPAQRGGALGSAMLAAHAGPGPALGARAAPQVSLSSWRLGPAPYTWVATSTRASGNATTGGGALAQGWVTFTRLRMPSAARELSATVRITNPNLLDALLLTKVMVEVPGFNGSAPLVAAASCPIDADTGLISVPPQLAAFDSGTMDCHVTLVLPTGAVPTSVVATALTADGREAGGLTPVVAPAARREAGFVPNAVPGACAVVAAGAGGQTSPDVSALSVCQDSVTVPFAVGGASCAEGSAVARLMPISSTQPIVVAQCSSST